MRKEDDVGGRARVQPFWRAHDRDRQTDRQTDRPRYSVCNNRLHLLRCGLMIITIEFIKRTVSRKTRIIGETPSTR